MSRPSLQASYAYCHDLMRTAARNFYYGMRLLPEAKRNGMYALYSYMRLCDDLADAPLADAKDGARALLEGDPATPEIALDQRRRLLDDWRDQTHSAIAAPLPSHPIWPAFHDTVRRFGIPARVFDDAIDGQIQDLQQSLYHTFDELYRYCYRVASTVGIAALHIWGFREQRALKLAEQRGIAMQLTNILRDIREDTARGRQYIPDEDLQRFELTLADLSHPLKRHHFDALLQFETARAREYYQQSAELEELVTPDSRPTLQVMTGIYRRILDRISANPHLVLIRRVGLTTLEKLTVVAQQTYHAHFAPLRV
jgi:15-cis-phytoene synthase